MPANEPDKEARNVETAKSLPQKLSDELVQLILDEHLQAGDRLPNEAVLAERLGAGRSSVREAVKLLASRNIVAVRQGSGTYVTGEPGVVDDPLGLTFVEDKPRLVRDLLEVRFMIEPTVAQMAAQRATEQDAERIGRLCDEVERLIEQGEDHTAADVEFHRAVALSSGNIVVPRLIPVINSSIPLFIDVTQNVLARETLATHRELARAIAAHDALRAHDAMYLHLVYNREKIAELLGERAEAKGAEPRDARTA